MSRYDDAVPPPELKQQVTGSLKARGLLGGAGTGRRQPWLRAAAAVMLLAGGAAVGRLSVRSGAAALPDTRPQYMLLLYEDSSFAGRGDPQLVAEYGAWADSLARTGALVSGEKLADEGGAVLHAAGIEAGTIPASAELAGYFIVSAASEEDALGIARACPHLRHGGFVALRRIEPT